MTVATESKQTLLLFNGSSWLEADTKKQQYNRFLHLENHQNQSVLEKIKFKHGSVTTRRIKAAGKSCVTKWCESVHCKLHSASSATAQKVQLLWLLVLSCANEDADCSCRCGYCRGRKCTHLFFTLAKGVFLPVSFVDCQTQYVRQFLQQTHKLWARLLGLPLLKSEARKMVCSLMFFLPITALLFLATPKSVYVRVKRNEAERREKMTTILMPIIT